MTPLAYNYSEVIMMLLSKKDLGEKIKKARKTKAKLLNIKFTQADLATKLGVSRSYIGDIEAGRKSPNLILLNKIADALNVSIDRLTGEAASAIIEDQCEKMGMTLEEVAEKTKVPLYWLQHLDDFIPGQFDDPVRDENEGYELEWDAIISDDAKFESYRSYLWITRVAEVLNLSASRLRAALARQEISFDEEPLLKLTPEEDFGPASDNTVESAGFELSDEENELITRFRKLPPSGQQMIMQTLENIENMLKENAATEENTVS
jgi:transcriptional regulator with XRE-family HTH domain